MLLPSHMCLFVGLGLFFFFFFKIYLFIYGCAGSPLLPRLFSRCSEQGLLSLWCPGFSLRWLLLLQSRGSIVEM